MCSLRSDLGRLLSSGLGADCDIVLEDGESLRACRPLLTCRSLYFGTLFSGAWRVGHVCSLYLTQCQESSELVVKAVNIDLPLMGQILRFIYTDAVKPADVPQALQLVELSRYYGLSGLRLACQDYICSRVCLDNVVEVRMLLALSFSVCSHCYFSCFSSCQLTG